MADKLFELRGASLYYPLTRGVLRRPYAYVKAVDGVDLDIYEGETLGIVGESGCGKTTLGKALALLEGLTGGSLRFHMDGSWKDLGALSKEEKLAWHRHVQMIFQDPAAALNPMKRIYNALEEPLKVQGMGDRAAREAVMQQVLSLVGLSLEALSKYPHEFSGGQRQRICIARALEIEPNVLVCDEAVSALDVSIQAQVLNLLRSIQRQKKLTMVFIAHDLSVVHYMSDRILVMYLGRAVELARAADLCARPLHPYTQSLLSAVPIPKIGARRERKVLLGDVPSPVNVPSGCAFHERCDRCRDICCTQVPLLRPSGQEGHLVACHFA